MRWVEKIEWNGDNYRVITVSEGGQKGDLPVAAIHDIELDSSEALRMRIVTDLQTWRVAPPETYLARMGFQEDTGNGQDVYEFEGAGNTFQVPATVLMKGVFRPLRGLAPQLFRPQGLENTVVAPVGRELGQVGFHSSPLDVGIEPRRAASNLAALSWMYCFPSPRRMWNSVLENARMGRLGLSLPDGKATVVVRALSHDEKWLVTNLTVIAVDVREEPFEFATGHTRRINFHQGAQAEADRKQKDSHPLDGLRSGNGGWYLTDDEWTAVKDVVSRRKMQRHSLREVINCILAKFGEGISWNAMQYGKLNRNVVVKHYQQMLQDGRWEAFVPVIQEMRAPPRS